jgi:sugar/nucleoside kinase (ribokinase family)
VLDVLVAGHVCLDLTPTAPLPAGAEPGRLLEVGPLAVAAGGCVANTGRALARHGLVVGAAATVGADALGGVLRDLLSREGFARADLATTAAGSTAYSIVFESAGVDRCFWHHAGANDAFTGADVAVAGARVLHLGYPPLLPAVLPGDGAPLRALFARAREAGVTTSLDLAVVDPSAPAGRIDWRALYAAVLPLTDVVSPSLDDLTSALGIAEPYSPGLVRSLAEELLSLGAAVVAITAGGHGPYLATAPGERFAAGGPALAGLPPAWWEVRRHAQPPPTRAVTTNGAGDASTAGLLAALLAGAEPAGALAAMTASAAAVLHGRTRPAPG